MSSAEAELAGIVKASAEMIGIASMFRDLGKRFEKKGLVYSDASAALGVAQRKRAGAKTH